VASSFGHYDHHQANSKQNYLQLSTIRTFYFITDRKFKAVNKYWHWCQWDPI